MDKVFWFNKDNRTSEKLIHDNKYLFIIFKKEIMKVYMNFLNTIPKFDNFLFQLWP